MASKNRFGTFMTMAAGAATAAAVITYNRQKREAITRLQGGSQIIQTRAGQVEYLIAGEGPTVLSIHGSPGGYDQGMTLGQPLVDAGFKVISVSRFGYLRTPPAADMSAEAQADQFAALLDKLQIPDIAVLGTSGGGPSAIQFARRHPDRCRALVLLCAATRKDISEDGKGSPALRLIEKAMRSDFLTWLILTGTFKGLPLLGDMDPARQPETASTPARKEMFKGMLLSTFPASLRQAGTDSDMALIRGMGDLPLEEIKVPTLVVHGTADGQVPFNQSEQVAGQIPGARLAPIEGGDHDVFIRCYEQVWTTIGDFIRNPRVSAKKKKATK